MQRLIHLSFVSIVLLLIALGSAAAQVTVFDGTFSRGTGQPVTVHSSFVAVEGKGTIGVYNGGIDGGKDRRVSDATIRVNGVVVFDEKQFNRQVSYLEAEVDLLAVNDLDVFVEGSPSSRLRIRVVWPPSEIAEFWNRLARLYQTSLPSEAVLTEWFAANVAPDFVQGGTDYHEMLAEWVAGAGPTVGMTFSPVVTGPLDVTGIGYTKGYRIRLDYTAGGHAFSLITGMVFDGTRWLWYGDQAWVEPEFMSNMSMTVHFDGTTVLETGLAVTLWDGHDCFAYRHGVRSAIVTGPGLPSQGRTLYHMYPLPYLRLYPSNPMNAAGDWFVPLDDAVILTIPDAAEYTFRLYSESADVVTLADTALTTIRLTNAKRPLLSTELNASRFPTLVAPATHSSSDPALNIGGPIEVRWTNPQGATVRYVSLGLTRDSVSFENVSSNVVAGAESVALDTTAYPRSGGWRAGSLYLGSADEYGRGFGLHWIINPWW